ncbi:MAG: urease accessory protein UreD [Xenococcaceae cyanobacterium MO_167.B27]|nr:urease accessory protein UreD [Xenococcaceae cyanobacterium MO_167.B27]
MDSISVPGSQDYFSRSQLQIQLQQNNLGHTVITHKYSEYPLCISHPFYLDSNRKRAYLYLGNNSPGLFPRDDLHININLEENTSVYLTDRAATKIYPTTNPQDIAQVSYKFNIAAGACLEYVPESLILYQNAALEQITKITMDSSSTLFLSEIILPGRLARGEYYQFYSYFNRLQVYSWAGDLWFTDGMYLSGIKNSFQDSHLFALYPILGIAIAVLSNSKVKLLQTKIDKLELPNNLIAATSILPGKRGLLIRVNGQKNGLIKQYFTSIINELRHLNQDESLPYIPK